MTIIQIIHLYFLYQFVIHNDNDNEYENENDNENENESERVQSHSLLSYKDTQRKGTAKKNHMTDTKQYLQSIQKLKRTIEHKKNLLGDLQITYKAETDKKSISEMTERINKLENEINNDLLRLTNIQHKTVDAMRSLDALYCNLLYRRYIQNKSLKTIARELKYSYGYIRSIHKYALEKFNETITEMRKYDK